MPVLRALSPPLCSHLLPESSTFYSEAASRCLRVLPQEEHADTAHRTDHRSLPTSVNRVISLSLPLSLSLSLSLFLFSHLTARGDEALVDGVEAEGNLIERLFSISTRNKPPWRLTADSHQR